MLVNVLLVLDELVAHGLFGIGCHRTQLVDAIDDVGDQIESIDVVQDGHVEGRRRRTFLLVAAHMQVLVIGAPVGQAMNQPRIAVVGENDGLVPREYRVEIPIRNTMGVL